MIVKLYIYHFVFSVCQLGVNLVNRSLDARSALLVSCYLPSLCTGFQCCVDVPDLNMSFNAYLSVDPCNYMLTVGIEKFTFNKSLDHYTFGKSYIKCKTSLDIQQHKQQFSNRTRKPISTYKNYVIKVEYHLIRLIFVTQPLRKHRSVSVF